MCPSQGSGFCLAVQQGVSIPGELTGDGPCWLHSAAARLGREFHVWVWWRTEESTPRTATLEDILEEDAPFDRDDVLRLILKRHWDRLTSQEDVLAIGYRRTRSGILQLELRFDGIAGCLRTPQGGSSRQYLIARRKGQVHARLLTVREAARLMGVPDSFPLPGNYNDGYMAVGMPLPFRRPRSQGRASWLQLRRPPTAGSWRKRLRAGAWDNAEQEALFPDKSPPSRTTCQDVGCSNERRRNHGLAHAKPDICAIDGRAGIPQQPERLDVHATPVASGVSDPAKGAFAVQRGSCASFRCTRCRARAEHARHWRQTDRQPVQRGHP